MNPHDDDVQEIAYAPLAETRPFYWSVRRELWENRSVYLAPLIVAAIVLFASLVNTLARPATLDRPFKMAPAPIMLSTFIVGLFYCLDALYGERRDRSILFWKSLPVSDRTVVLSKAAVPFLVLPLIALALSLAAQLVLLFAGIVVRLAGGSSPLDVLAQTGFFPGILIMIYGLTVHVLWFAPIYGWLLLVSAWARRAPVLWAVLPMLAVAAVERIALGTMGFLNMLQYRVMGAMTEAFVNSPASGGNIDRLTALQPGRFLTRPGLWAGLLFAAGCVLLAIRLRRLREPI
jgi:ABC-2 type transport system permease protein